MRHSPPEPLENPDMQRDWTTPPSAGLGVRLDALGKRFGDRDVLNDITLVVPAGSVIALVGDNGAGKTTLVKLLARFYERTAGEITIGGVPLGEIDIATWRAGLSACLQDFSRFEFVAHDTVGVGSLADLEDTTRVEHAVASAGAEDVVGGHDQGLRTQLGTAWEGGAELSVGQWQKLALGRAMMRETPSILLLDEPTAALDASAEARLFERYAAASQFAARTGTITVIVSHRMSTVRMADVIAVIEGGRLREFGTHAELIAADGPYRELYQTQAAAYVG
jgi:ATP-binding cassette subfamily B protein